jgi:26S proteasome regulatory subunit N1
LGEEAEKKDKPMDIVTAADAKIGSIDEEVTSILDIELTVEPIVKITREDLLPLATEIAAFYMKHNAEADACDLLMEIEHVDTLFEFVEKETYQRVCLYLLSCVPYVPEPEDSILLKAAFKIYLKFQQDQLALRCAIQLNDMDMVQDVFYNCKDK